MNPLAFRTFRCVLCGKIQINTSGFQQNEVSRSHCQLLSHIRLFERCWGWINLAGLFQNKTQTADLAFFLRFRLSSVEYSLVYHVSLDRDLNGKTLSFHSVHSTSLDVIVINTFAIEIIIHIQKGTNECVDRSSSNLQ